MNGFEETTQAPVEYTLDAGADVRRMLTTRDTIGLLKSAHVSANCADILTGNGALAASVVLQSGIMAVEHVAILPGIGNSDSSYGAQKPSYTVTLVPAASLTPELQECSAAAEEFVNALKTLDESLRANAASLPADAVHPTLKNGQFSLKTGVTYATKDKPREPIPSGAKYTGSDGSTFHAVPCFRMSKDAAGRWSRRPIHPSAIDVGDLVTVGFSLSSAKTSTMAYISRYLKCITVWAEAEDVDRDPSRSFDLPM